ncbi:hypothetical protein [Thiomonas sp.]
MTDEILSDAEIDAWVERLTRQPPQWTDVHIAAKLEALRLARAKRRRAEQRIEQIAQELIAREEVAAVLRDVRRVVEDELRALPERATPAVRACRNDPAAMHEALAKAARDTLQRICDALLSWAAQWEAQGYR